MFVLDTDTMTLLQHGHERVAERFRLADRKVATTLISRIEVLEGRFASVIKAANGGQLLLAQEWLERSESSAAGPSPCHRCRRGL